VAPATSWQASGIGQIYCQGNFMNFFGHDSNASNDPRIKKVLIKYGYEGYGLYFHILELIARHMDPPREQTCELQEDFEILTADSQGHSKIKKIEEMVNYMLEIELFTKTSKFQCLKMLRRLSDAQKKKFRRTTDGQLTDNVRGEVNRSEDEEKRKEKKEKKTEFGALNQTVVAEIENRKSIHKGELNKNVPSELQKLFDQEESMYQMLQKPGIGSEKEQLFKAELNRIKSAISNFNRTYK